MPTLSLGTWFIACALIAILTFYVVRVASYITFRIMQHRLRQNKSLIHEYSVNPELSPVEAGYLLDRAFTHHELAGTLVALYNHNQISIVSHDTGITIKQRETRRSTKLSWTEMHLLSHVKDSQSRGITWEELRKSFNSSHDFQQGMERAVRRQLIDNGYIESGTHTTLIMHRKLRNFLGLATSVLFVFLPLNATLFQINFVDSSGFSDLDHAMVAILGILLSILLWPVWNFYINALDRLYVRGAGLPIGATNKLYAAWRQIAGFSVFLHVVEANRLKLSPNLHNEYAAWCLSLGIGPTFEEIARHRK